ncbi:MAG: N-6 DNA methylase [Nitrospirae bacterium]|uniref:N-6 DNA methylase n=1 Tax=Candidatus Magnetobacterium casense TaxID=1455061 RepID=UPI0006966C83|nr:N-6 DNA methylase [Candidatus Magnetobacterium casensis]MBF0336434.1 N-6 DNA methylase [Nitrospirota bacterium]
MKEGNITDFISGLEIEATPEEVEAVQVFSKQLVEDYNYPKDHIQTRPQFRVKVRPSDTKKEYPLDIAVFTNSKKQEDNIYIIIECKKKSKKDGKTQLRDYLKFSRAILGVWFNGDEKLFIRKIEKHGRVEFEDIPNIPIYGQRIDDIGKFKRKDLKPPHNLKVDFKTIRNHLAGMTTGITRDETLAKEIINILFCKILDEQETDMDKTVMFRAGVGEDPNEVYRRILDIFERVKIATFEDVFEKSDSIRLDPDSLYYVVGQLQNYCIMDADRDAIGDAFEVFIGPALRGSEGQFFTPRNVVKLMVEIINPMPGEKIIDPACGSGGFLIGSLDHVWGRIREDAKSKGWSEKQLIKREIDVATECFRGIDKDAFLAKVCKAYMALVGDGRGGIFCENSLKHPNEWSRSMFDKVQLGKFDIILTNPPFGKNIVVKGDSLLSQFEFGYKWKKDKKTGEFTKTSSLCDEQSPQLIFLERCLQLLREGGRMGIVLPESILGNPSYEYIITYLFEKVTLIGVVTMPESLFKTSGKGGTHTKVCTLFMKKSIPYHPYPIFMAEAKWCGHDSRGNPTIRISSDGEEVLLDDIPDIIKRFKEFTLDKSFTANHLGFTLSSETIRNRILVPKYYNPEIETDITSLSITHNMVTIEELLKNGIITLDTGVEIGKMAYGTGTIPFIRTSDISNWEIKADFKHGISKQIYENYKSQIDVLAGDILMVRDGTYLIGNTAIVTESDVPMIFQSHIYRIRVVKPDSLSPWLLFACLNSPIVRRQVRAKQFTQDIIDTLGKRLFEIALPIPKEETMCNQIAYEMQEVIETRIRLRNRAKEIAMEVEGIEHYGSIDIEIQNDM